MTDTTSGLTTRAKLAEGKHPTNATIDARHLIDPTNNRVTVLETMDKGYLWVQFPDGAENAFPTDAVTLDAPNVDSQVTECVADMHRSVETYGYAEGLSRSHEAAGTAVYHAAYGIWEREDEARADAAEPTTLDKLEAIAHHVRKHGLYANLSTTRVFHAAAVQLHAPQGESAIAALRPWINSLGAGTIAVHKVADDYHLTAQGTIGHGVPLSVVALTDDAETAALDEVIRPDSKLNGDVPVDVVYACQRPRIDAALSDEAKHWADNPIAPAAVRMHTMSVSCWCAPRYENASIVHNDIAEPVFASTDSDPIDANGYPTEDHR